MTNQPLTEIEDVEINDEHPVVSIIVPVYNGGAHLDRCLSAIRQSTCTQYDLIVVDNGSTDNSVAIAKSHGAIVLHCPGPSGPGAARNTGAKGATGMILFFVDADVVIRPDTTTRIVEHFQLNTEVAAVFGSYDDNPPASNFLSQYKNLLHHFVHQEGNRDASTFWGGCGAIRKNVFQTVKGFDQDRYPNPSIEDIELGYRLRSQGYHILLDKDLQVTHLKEWRLKSLLRADILYRAVPWSKLILESHGMINDLNLQGSQRVCGGLACLIFLLLPFIWVHPLVALILFVLSITVFIVNRKLFLFFLNRKGVRFLFLAFPMHLVYYLYSVMTFVLCGAQFALQGKQPVTGMGSSFRK
jgi:GT2 family glycosyltransferase